MWDQAISAINSAQLYNRFKNCLDHVITVQIKQTINTSSSPKSLLKLMSFSPSPLSPAQAQTSSDDDYIPSPTPTGSSSPSLNQDQEPASSSIWSHESRNLTPPGRRKHEENISDHTHIAL